jgi:hypothetical protein
MTFHDAEIVDAAGTPMGMLLDRSLQRDATARQLQCTRPIPTLTVCFRNLLDSLPAEFDQAPALDLCLWSLLGLHGAAKFMPEVQPAVYRVHGGGVFSLQGQRSRYLMTAQSLLCLSRVHAREGRAELADALLSKASRMAGSRLPVHAAAATSLQLAAMAAAAAARRAWMRLRAPAAQ